MSIELLTHLITPPYNPLETGTPKVWEKVEARLGIALPSDYKSLVDTYGTGAFHDCVMIYNPFTENESLNPFYVLDVLHRADQQTGILMASNWTAVHPFDLYPAPEGLLPWGCTTNFGDFFFWQVKGPPQTWETVFYNLRHGEYEVWKLPLTEFLYQLFTRKIESVLLPQDFPLTQNALTFSPGFG